MGSGVSRLSQNNQLLKTEEEIVRLMMPVYYSEDPITDEEYDLALNSWRMILNNSSPEFLANKKNVNFPYPTCIIFFYNSFYDRLFDIHPVAKNMFKDMRSQGKFLVKMISLSLSERENAAKYQKTLIKLAEIHNNRGIKAVEYGVVGEVLFWSIRLCVGPLVYTYDVHQAWVKIYSNMLKIMVPSAVGYELKNNSGQEKRFLCDSIHLSNAEESVLHDFNLENDKKNSREEGDYIQDLAEKELERD